MVLWLSPCFLAGMHCSTAFLSNDTGAGLAGCSNGKPQWHWGAAFLECHSQSQRCVSGNKKNKILTKYARTLPFHHECFNLVGISVFPPRSVSAGSGGTLNASVGAKMESKSGNFETCPLLFALSLKTKRRQGHLRRLLPPRLKGNL